MSYCIVVSIVVTTFCRKKQLGETIDSILKQTFSDFELIVVDNYSDYDFFGFIDSFNDSRIKGFQNSNNGIIATNRNYGINRATGKFLAFCDDDDFWVDDKLSKQLALLKSLGLEDEMVVVHSNAVLFGIGVVNRITRKKNIGNINDFLFYNDVTLSSVLVTNSRLVLFNEAPIFKASEDYNLWLELLLTGHRFLLVDEPLVNYRIDSTSVSRFNVQSYKHLLQITIVLFNIVTYKVEKVSVVKLFIMIIYEYLKFMIRFKFKKFKL